jgi:hypothetical protein
MLRVRIDAQTVFPLGVRQPVRRARDSFALRRRGGNDGARDRLLGEGIEDFLRSNLKRKDMLAEVSGLIGGEDSKPDLTRSLRKNRLSFKETRLAGIIQIEFIRNLIFVNPLSPYFEFLGIPETSGSDGAPSEHPDFSPHQNCLSSL